MVDMTEDERTVLELAVRGESLSAIGHWERPIKSLVANGLLYSRDSVNNVITAAGRVAFEEADNAALAAVVNTTRKIELSHAEIRNRVEKAAELLSEAAKFSSRVTGDDVVTSCRKWNKQLLERALELVDV